jgi:folylpolyglutamate synthase/dihydropteroate synthase
VVAGGDVPSALKLALDGREGDRPVLVCGSLFVVGEAMAEVGADLEQL